MLIIAAATEADIAELESYEERQMFEDLGLEESGVARLIKSAYKLLNPKRSSPPEPTRPVPGPTCAA